MERLNNLPKVTQKIGIVEPEIVSGTLGPESVLLTATGWSLFRS